MTSNKAINDIVLYVYKVNLYISFVQRSYAKIHRWCTITLVLIITRAAFFITAAFFTADTAFVSSFGFIGFLYQLFCLWFVRMYEDRLRACGIKAANFDTLEEDDGSCTSSSVGGVGMDSFVIGESALYKGLKHFLVGGRMKNMLHRSQIILHSFKRLIFFVGLGGEDRRYSMSSSKLKASTASAAACQFSQQNELHGQKSCGHLEKT